MQASKVTFQSIYFLCEHFHCNFFKTAEELTKEKMLYFNMPVNNEKPYKQDGCETHVNKYLDHMQFFHNFDVATKNHRAFAFKMAIRT